MESKKGHSQNSWGEQEEHDILEATSIKSVWEDLASNPGREVGIQKSELTKTA